MKTTTRRQGYVICPLIFKVLIDVEIKIYFCYLKCKLKDFNEFKKPEFTSYIVNLSL